MALIIIDENMQIGRGRHRKCYKHPFNSNQCIKVNYSGHNSQQSEDPKNYRLLQKNGIDWTHLAKFYGSCKTNIGVGLIFELIKDFNGRVSKSLDYKLKRGDFLNNCECLHKELFKLKEYTLEYLIFLRNISCRNILVQYPSKEKYRLVIVDDIGCKELIPIYRFSKTLTKVKIEKRWAKFFRQMNYLKPLNK